MAHRDDGERTEELLARAVRLIALLGAEVSAEPLDAFACDGIAAALEDLVSEVTRLRDALRGQGLTDDAAIDAAAERGRWMLEAADRPHAQRPLAGFRVAVVDDEPDTLDALTLVLENAGAAVWAYADAVTALAGAGTCRPHVLVSDLAMPGYDGLWLVRQIRDTERLSRLPAIALSAHALSTDLRDAKLAGFDAHLAKPTLPERLIAEVARLAALVPARPGDDDFEGE
jgi:CheY-like chemotaxis protein